MKKKEQMHEELVTDIQFSDLFNLEDIQNFQNLFADAHGVASIITNPEGVPITKASNFTRFCSNIIRETEKGCANCYKSDAVLGRHHPSGPVVQPCLSGGLWDAGASITVGGRHIASWLIGQVRNEEINEQQLMLYADEIGANRVEFRKALNEVPVMSVEHFNKISKMLFAFANELSEKAYNNLQLNRQIVEKVKATALLQHSEQMLHTVLDNFPGVVFWKDAQSNYLGCNLAFANGAGLNSSAEIVGKTDFDLPWAETEAANYRADDFHVVESGNAKLHIVEMQHQTNGQLIWLDTSKIPIRDYRGQVIGVIGVSNDITEIKQAQEVINEKNKELENYLYIASHDLRSPLVNVQGFSQRLLKQAGAVKSLLESLDIDAQTKEGIDKITDEDIPKTLNFIFSNVQKMDMLINGLLQISRTGRMPMNIVKIDMNRLFKNIIAAFNFQITELSAKIIIGDLADCFGDENQLNQLFSNIIGNAIKYRDNNRLLVLEISSVSYYSKVTYSIKDTGIGINQRHLDKIWDVFFRVDSQLPEAGEGIGLSLAKRITDKHKGKIWAESEQGKGSTFFIELNKNDFNE